MTGAFSRAFNDEAHAQQKLSFGERVDQAILNVFIAVDGAIGLPLAPQGLVDAAAGFGDAASFDLTDKLRDVLDFNGVVNQDSTTYNVSNVIGTFVPGLGTAALLRGGAALGGTRVFRILNENRYFRIGPGLISRSAGTNFFNYGAGRNIPMLRISNGAPSSLNHFDLRIFGF